MNLAEAKIDQVLRSLDDKVPEILAVTKGVTLDRSGLVMVQNMLHKMPLDADTKEEIHSQIREALEALHSSELKAQGRLFEADRQTNSKDGSLTRSARPVRQYAWLAFLFFCYPVSVWLFGHTIELPELILLAIFTDMGLYSVLRSREKVAKSKSLTQTMYNNE